MLSGSVTGNATVQAGNASDDVDVKVPKYLFNRTAIPLNVA